MSHNKDQLLLTATLNGDMQAFAKLVAKYEHMVFTLALKMTGETVDAEEVAQDVFLKAYQSLSGFKGESKFSTWLYKITYRRSLDYMRKNKKRVAQNSLDELTNLNIPALENNWDTLEMIERKHVIKNAINQLKERDAVLITLFYYEELSLNEMADVLSLQVNAVKVKLFRARKRLAYILRKKLEPEIISGYER